MKNKEVASKNRVPNAKRLPCVTICQIGNQKFLASLKRTNSFHILEQDFTQPRHKSKQAFEAFLSASFASNSCNNELVSPSKKFNPRMDQILANACKRMNNDPS